MSKKRSQRNTKKFLKGLKAKRQKFYYGGYGCGGGGTGPAGFSQSNAGARTSREAERAAIARALGLDAPAPLLKPSEREPLQDDIPQARTVLCARTT